MSTGVFTITADIAPEIDEKELENQAKQISNKLNGLLSQTKVKLGGNSFSGIKDQAAQAASNITQSFQKALNNIPKILGPVAKEGKKAFLGFTDAINLTRRDIVGFGGSILDSIRFTNRFKDSLGGIKAAGGVFDTLQLGFQSTIASVRSGTSVVDQFARSGDHLAQLFLPFTRTSAAAQLNLEGLQQTLKGVAATLQTTLTSAGGKGTDALNAASVSTGSLNKNLNNIERTFLRLGEILPKGTKESKAFFDTYKEAKASGGVDSFVKGLVQQRDAANKLAGPLGFLKVKLGLVDEELRKADKTLRNETNQALVKIEKQFPGTVVGLDHFLAKIRNLNDTVSRNVTGLKNFGKALATIGPGPGIGVALTHAFDTTDAVGKADNFFKSFNKRFALLQAEGKVSLATIGEAFKKTFGELNAVTNFNTKMGEVKTRLGLLGTSAVLAAKFFKDDLANAFTKVVNASKAVVEFGRTVGGVLQKGFEAFKGSEFGKDLLPALEKIGAGFRVMGEGARKVGAVINDAFKSSTWGTATIATLNDIRTGLRLYADQAVKYGKDVGTSLRSSYDAALIGAKLYTSQAISFAGNVGTAIKTQLVSSLNDAKIGIKLYAGQALELGKSIGTQLRSGFDNATIGIKLFASSALGSSKTLAKFAAPFLLTIPSIRDGLGSLINNGTLPLIASITAVGRSIVTVIGNSRFAAPLLEGLNLIRDGFKIVLSGVGDVGKAILNQFSRIGSSIGDLFKAGLDKASSFFNKFKSDISKTDIGGGLVDKLGRITSSIGRLLSKTGTKIKESFKATDFGPDFKPAPAPRTLRAIRAASEKAKEVVVPESRVVTPKVEEVKEKIAKETKEKTPKVKESKTPITVKAPVVINATNVEIKGVGTKELTTPIVVKAPVTLVATNVEFAGVGPIDIGTPVAVRAPINLEATSVNLPDISNGLKALTAKAANAGTELVAGLDSGIISGAPSLNGAVHVIDDAVVGEMKRIWGIASKSKVGHKIGTDLDDGIASGIEDGKGKVEKASRSLVGGSIKIMKDLITTAAKATVGKGPSEDVGRIGKAFGAALTPLRLFASAGLGVLKTGFHEVTAAAKVAGVAFTAFAGTAIVTGAQFNSLQAVVRGTLPVILGSADATNKLLEQVNELNDTSPFARSAFLELTRVLAGFGVQAEKIAPLIDSIQQAVAATGGGEQDLLELGQAFARVQSQGRLSLDVIQSFSSRGIDVIQILGQQFHKTSGEVRDMISNGLVPANKAIDALTAGLQDKFKGATDAVAKNLPGALDRVKAKTRDFGAALTKAFVSPTGGGAAIDLVNAFATAIGGVTKILLPILAPALQKVADIITDLSKKVTEFTQKFTGAAKGAKDFIGGLSAQKGIKEFASGLTGLIGPLAALTGLLPGFIEVLPVIGPFLGKFATALGGPEIAITAFLLTLKPVRAGLADFVRAIAPLATTLLPKMSRAFSALENAVGPIIGKIFGALGPIVLAAGDALGELFDQLGPIFDAFGRLFEAISPIVDIVKNEFIQQFQLVKAAFAFLGPLIVKLINFITALAEKFKPLLQNAAKAADSLTKMDIFPKIFEKIGDAVSAVIDKLDALKNAAEGVFSFLKKHGVFKFLGDVTGVNGAINGVEALYGKLSDTKGVSDASRVITQSLVDQSKAADKATKELIDGYGTAKKAAEDADNAVSGLTDQVKQQISTVEDSFNKLLGASEAVKAAHKAQQEAITKSKEANIALRQTQIDQAKALRDVIKPADELAKAQRNLAKTQYGLIQNDREQIDLQNQLKDLQGEGANDKRAELDRSLERAKIALNKARQDEIDLLNESNRAETTSIDLSGLSVDQIHSRLANFGAVLKAQQELNAKTGGKNAQQTADEKTSAKLDVADAEQAVKDATKARQQFEVDTSNQIRDNEEKLASLQGDKIDALLEEQTQLNHINDLRAGETAQQAIIKEFDDKIKAAKDAAQKAAEAVTEASKASAIAELDLKAKSAEVAGKYEEQAGYQQKIHDLKKEGLTFDKDAQTALDGQVTTIKTLLTDLDTAKRKAGETLKTEQEAAVSALRGQGTQSNILNQTLKAQLDANGGKNVFNKDLNDSVQNLNKNFSTVLTNVVTSGSLLNKTNDKVTLDDNQIQDLIAQFSDIEGTAIGQGQVPNFFDILKQILTKIGLHIPGFAAGYAPGEIHSGMNNGTGLVRMFEYGKEAVLPLTRKLDMFRVVNSPTVLPAILDALPKMSITNNARTSPTLSSSKGTISTSYSANSHSDVARRKEQGEFAGTVSSAVKSAMKEAFSESGSSFGSDVAINVHSSSNNEIIIAREVKRQIEKVLGR